MKKRKKYRKRIFGYKYLVIIVLIALISVGYAALSSTIGVGGDVKIIGGLYTIKYNLIHTTSEEDVSNPVEIRYGEDVGLTIKPEDGYFLYKGICENGYLIDGMSTGIDTYEKTQILRIKNNNNPATSICSFYSRKVAAVEVAYTKTNHSDLTDVKKALDYLYEALGYEDLPPETIEAILVAYTHDNHPEFATVQDALDYIYEKTS